MSLLRTYGETIHVARGELDWDLVSILASWLAAELKSSEIKVHVLDSDGKYETASIEEAREHHRLSASRVSLLGVRVGESMLMNPLVTSRVSVDVGSDPGSVVTEVWVEGCGKKEVLGLASALRQAVERGALTEAYAPTPDPLPGDAQVAAPARPIPAAGTEPLDEGVRADRRTWLEKARHFLLNPWVYAIGGTIIAGLIVALILQILG